MYVAIFNEAGERITSIVEGIHFDGDYTSVVDAFLNDGGKYYLPLTQEEHSRLINEDLVYIDGELTERPAYIPTEEEKEEAEAEAIEDITAEVDENTDMDDKEKLQYLIDTVAELQETIEALKGDKDNEEQQD